MKNATIKKCAAAGLLACMVLFFTIRLQAEEEKDYSLVCEKALVLCEMTLGFVPQLLWTCLMGYSYCEKYIEPLLRYLNN